MMMEQYFSPQQLSALSAMEGTGSVPPDRHLLALMEQMRDAMSRHIAPESEAARQRVMQWLRRLRDGAPNQAGLALKPAKTPPAEAAPAIPGMTQELLNWVTLASAHARLELFAPYLSTEELAVVRARQVAHLHEWPPLWAAVREQMKHGADPATPAVQELAQRWEEIFLASYCGDDKQLEAKIHGAFAREPDLILGVGLDMPLIVFIQRAMLHLHGSRRPASILENTAPKPSAYRVAVQRAVHQLLDVPVLFNDPLALKILDEADVAALRNSLDQYTNRMSTSLRALLVVRSRVAEDEWAVAQQAGVRQYVILGAGLDTFAYRRPAEHLGRVFEVDLPATQQWKRESLRNAGITEPEFVSYVPCDFERTTLPEALAQAGFRCDQPALFAWLGVTVYLDHAAVLETLRFIVACARGSGVVFDFTVEPALLSSMERIGFDLMAGQFAERGEPWKTFYDPAVLAQTLSSLGFSTVNSLGAVELNERYLADRSDGLRMGGMTRIMQAVV